MPQRTQLLSTFSMSMQVFRDVRYVLLAFVWALLFLTLYLLVPALLVPGESLPFEFAHLTQVSSVLLVVLALLSGVLAAFETYAFFNSHRIGARAIGRDGAGLLASLVGGILAAASCGCGVGILLGAIGLGGGALFVAAHQFTIILLMLAVVLVGLYFSARRAAGICATCRV